MYADVRPHYTHGSNVITQVSQSETGEHHHGEVARLRRVRTIPPSISTRRDIEKGAANSASGGDAR